MQNSSRLLKSQSERRVKKSDLIIKPDAPPLTFSPIAMEGLKNRLTVNNPNYKNILTLFDANLHFQLEVANIAILDQLAKGSYGVVYKGALDGESFAVKIEDVLPGIEEQVNLLVELTILQSLKHDRLVPYRGSGYLSKSSSGSFKVMIVMELCIHGALREGLRYPLPWPLRVRLGLDIAQGLVYLHERRIIHRDVKTTNVLIDEAWRAKLCDFSFACLADCPAKRAYVYGTDEFMSPEIAMGDDFDVSSDIFSFGILLCELITGREPSAHFLHREAKDLFALDEEELKSAIPLDCPVSMEALVLQCCAVDPSERPSAQECSDWLQAMLEEFNLDDIDFIPDSFNAMIMNSPEREGHVTYPKTHDLSLQRNKPIVLDGSDSVTRLTFLEVQIQELRAENRRLNREVNSLIHPERRLSGAAATRDKRASGGGAGDMDGFLPLPYMEQRATSPAGKPDLVDIVHDLRERLANLESKLSTGDMFSPLPVPSTTSRYTYDNNHSPSSPLDSAATPTPTTPDLEAMIRDTQNKVDDLADSVNRIHAHLGLDSPPDTPIRSNSTTGSGNITKRSPRQNIPPRSPRVNGYSTPKSFLSPPTLIKKKINHDGDVHFAHPAPPATAAAVPSSWQDMERAMGQHVDTFRGFLSQLTALAQRSSADNIEANSNNHSSNYNSKSNSNVISSERGELHISSNGTTSNAASLITNNNVNSNRSSSEQLSTALHSFLSLVQESSIVNEKLSGCTSTTGTTPLSPPSDIYASPLTHHFTATNNAYYSLGSDVSDIDADDISRTWRDVSPPGHRDPNMISSPTAVTTTTTSGIVNEMSLNNKNYSTNLNLNDFHEDEESSLLTTTTSSLQVNGSEVKEGMQQQD